eukprot:TRINITY_DN20035_c0_g2_i2.p1 TRINITY_DN20035_c0_g2~~TRINITY_DN20035_c0_g2_i2.p1  ORF type:complete len:306 (-),score=124.17 TRINITY_DN20035_c0_g2_i2:102-1019(-)
MEVHGAAQHSTPALPCTLVQDCGLQGHLSELERAVPMLRMILEAKVETLGLIRTNLSNENEALKQQLQHSAGQQQELQQALEAAEQRVEEERAELRGEFEEIQQLYSHELARLQAEVSVQATPNAAQHSAARCRELEAEVCALQEALGAAQVQLADDHKMRARLAAELQTERNSAVVAANELKALKNSQKFLGAPPGERAVPEEKVDLMNLVNHLFSESHSLKEEKLLLQNQLQAMHLAALDQQLDSRIGQKELSMAGANLISDMDITAKILRRNMMPSTTAAAKHAQDNPLTTTQLYRLSLIHI